MLEKLFNKDKRKISTTLNADQIKSIFATHGINIETIGFPYIGWRNNAPLDRYSIAFEDITIKPITIDDNPSIKIEGKYRTQAQIGGKDEQGRYYPATASHYKFKIEEGKLNINKN